MKKAIFFITGAALTICVLITIYFAANVTGTIPSIEEFKCQGNLQQLVAKFKILADKQPNLTLSFSKALGSETTGFAYHITLKTKYNSHDLLYDIKLEDKSAGSEESELKLIAAHDLTNKTGGYGKSISGMPKLLNQFEHNIITPLRNSGVVITYIK